jgi:lipopolysaccharide transport system ATP-binding protein
MSETVIRVENLSKKYIIGHQKQERYTALRDVLANQVKSIGQIFSRNSDKTDPAHEEFWALKDVSFEIKQGDRVGIIGRNGAGKSTLLKILSRITEPTEGRISINGRVASLLEVGTGFHPELTGRENIYLNGAILGMDRVEIKRKFDEIVAFAEVEKFLDTPVKRYSSGMYVRLAFAVAAHLEPEILIVDEVLAVGDSQFQKKCLGKMEDVSKEGRTVLFVSHNMVALTKLCQRAIWLINGTINSEGKAEEIASRYLNDSAESSGEITLLQQLEEHRFCFQKVFLVNSQEFVSSTFDLRESIKVCIRYKIIQIIPDLEISLKVINAFGISIFKTDRSSYFSKSLKEGEYVSEIEIPSLFLCPDVYTITIASYVDKIEIIAIHENLLSFEVVEMGSKMSIYQGQNIGVVLVDLPWKETLIVDSR